MTGIRYSPEEYERLKNRDMRKITDKIITASCQCPSSDAWVCGIKQKLPGECRCVCHINSIPAEKLVPALVKNVKNNPRGRHVSGEMNKSERSFAGHLEMRKAAGEIKSFKFEAIKLKLADNTYFIPDFDIEMANGDLVLAEVKRIWKGHKRPHYEDDSKVKIKVCAELFRDWFTVYGVFFDGEKWVYEPF